MREGYHFSFDEQCSRDLRRVQTLKNIGFSLSEIKQIMLNSTERLFAAEASSSICRQLYEKRLAESSDAWSRPAPFWRSAWSWRRRRISPALWGSPWPP